MGYDDAKDPASVKQTLHTAMYERRKAMGYDVQDPAAGVLNQIIGLLERADLTINVKPLSWFFDESRIKTKGPESFWAHVEQKKGYATRREEVEDELFNYSAPLVPNTAQHQTVAAGIQKHGSPALKDGKVTNPDFSAASRPVYAALNWLSLLGGGAYKYGHVYFVLNTYIKHKTTFLHGDTFHAGVANAANLANHFNYYPLVCNCKDNVLDAMMSPKDAKSQGVAREEYIDAQIHTPVLFKRDVKAVYFLKGDFLRNGNLGGPDAFAKVKPNFEKFCRHNGLTPTYID
jgi:hypothetical protein